MVSLRRNSPQGEEGDSRVLENNWRASNEPHYWARAISDSYTCCVYKTSESDYCLATDKECIDEFTEVHQVYFLIVGIVVGVVIMVLVLCFLCQYAQKRRAW